MTAAGSALRALATSQIGLCGLFWLFGVLLGDVALLAGEAASRSELDAQYQTELEQLAQRCDDLQLTAEARQTRQWFIPRRADRLYFFLPSSQAEQPAVDPQSTTDYWRQHFQRLRQERARQLFELAQRTVATQPAVAYQLLHEVLHEDPHHEQARAVLGYRLDEDGWQLGPGSMKVSTGRVSLPDYGFRAGGYWRAFSDHFLVLTNTNETRAAELADQLERLYLVWKQAYFDYWQSGRTLERRLADSRPAPPPSSRQRFVVVLFADRQQYLDQLRKWEPRIDQTIGLYLDQRRAAYFYEEQPRRDLTWRHEVTHQLFAESTAPNPSAGGRDNFWAMEGAALFMESLQDFDTYVTLGGCEADRLQYARYRALQEGFVVPLEQIVSWGRTDIQAHERIGALYSQFAGLVQFLMTHEQGRYRSAFAEYLQALYRGPIDADWLARHTQVDYAELDRQYLESLNVTDEMLTGLSAGENLCLTHTAVTDEGVAHVDLTGVHWLDLSTTAISNRSLDPISTGRELQRLSLEKTSVTSGQLAPLRQLRELLELDLSSLPVTDVDLEVVAQLPRLEVLWLTGTDVTDAGLQQLSRLKALRQLDVRGTRVTTAGLAALAQQLPELKLVQNP